MARASKLERLEIPPQSRVVKDWFPTRDSANEAIPGILAHIKTMGETHTCFCHTHTKPPADSVPVYIGEFSIPKKYRDVKRFCPCPCCWDEFAKFGHGKIAWFPEERVIRLIGPYCFRTLNAEGHETAQRNYEIEQERQRNTAFLLSNVKHLPDVVAVIERGIKVGKALERFHELLHNRLQSAGLNLWPYVRREGELPINVVEGEFRQNDQGEMYTQEVLATRTYAKLEAYEMLDPSAPRICDALEPSLSQIRQQSVWKDGESAIDCMSDEERRVAAQVLSRAVRSAKDKIAEAVRLRRFAERVNINTLRGWGAQKGCPIPSHFEHDGRHIRFGPRDGKTVGLTLPAELQEEIGEISFWTERQRGALRYGVE
jgi:hypothetical protein